MPLFGALRMRMQLVWCRGRRPSVFSARGVTWVQIRRAGRDGPVLLAGARLRANCANRAVLVPLGPLALLGRGFDVAFEWNMHGPIGPG